MYTPHQDYTNKKLVNWKNLIPLKVRVNNVVTKYITSV